MITYKQFISEISASSKHDILKLKKILTFKISKITPKQINNDFIKKVKKYFKNHDIFNSDILIFDSAIFSDINVTTETLNVFGSFLEGEVEDGDVDEPAEIILTVLYNPKDKVINFDTKQLDTFINLYLDALEHELNHFKQWTSKNYVDLNDTRKLSKKELQDVHPFAYVKKIKGRDYTKTKYKEDIEYYGKGFELESFALNAARELKNYYNTVEKANKALKNFSKLKIQQSPIINDYNILFKPGGLLMKKFIKLVLHYLNEKE